MTATNVPLVAGYSEGKEWVWEQHEMEPHWAKPAFIQESCSMAASSSGLKTDVGGSVPAALMSSTTEASQEKVSRAEGTCRTGQMSPGL